MKRSGIILLFTLLLVLTGWGQGTYYNAVSTGSASFVADLQSRIRSPYTHVSYANFDETNVANFASRDSAGTSGRVVTCVYSGQNYFYTGTFAWTTFSREHTWCHNWMPSNPADSPERDEYTDQHHLFPTNQNNANGIRSDHPLGTVVTVTSTYLNSKYGKDANGKSIFEPRDEHKGDAARALLYMALRYDGIGGYSWNFNTLNTRLSAISEGPMDPAMLIAWHKADPPRKWEVDRNDYIQSIQGNRNPFSDHPEYVNYINFSDLTKLSPSYAVEPTNQPTGISVSSPTSTSLTVSWTASVTGTQAPAGYLVEIFNSNDYFIPIDGSTYADDTNIGDSRGQVNVTSGTTYTFTGLTAATTYYVRIYPYNGSSTSTNYKLDGTVLSGSAATGGASLATEPTNYPTNFNQGTITTSSIQLTWTGSVAGTQAPSGYLLIASTVNSIAAPSDGTTYADDTNLADNNARVNLASNVTSYTFSGLPSATTYYFKLFPLNGSGSSINYKTDGSPPFQFGQTGGSGVATPSVIVNEYLNGSSNSTEWVELLVLDDNVDMRGMRLRDYTGSGAANTGITFTTNSAWQAVPIGTFIVILGGTNTQTEDLSYSGDKKMIVKATNATYFSGTSYDITGSNDALELMSASNTHLYSLGHGPYTGLIADIPYPKASVGGASSSGNVVRFVNVSSKAGFLDSTKVQHAAAASATQGTWNDSIESTLVVNTLPVELSAFTVQARGRSVELQWRTATETNNHGFEVQWSAAHAQNADAGQSAWLTIGFVAGHGTTNAPQSYSFSDASARGTVRYRLKQVDRDGAFSFSSVVEITANTVPQSAALLEAYPNPFNPATLIRFRTAGSGITSLQVYDIMGRAVATLADGLLEAGEHTAVFDAAALASGPYLCVLRSGNAVATTRLLLMK